MPMILVPSKILVGSFLLKVVGTDKNTDGRIDILANYGEDYTAIIELKKGILNDMALTPVEKVIWEEKKSR